MNLKYLKVENFLSIGDEPAEIDFTTLGPVVQIVGRNLDRGENASNSAGKSTIFMAILYGFYGKTLKDLSQKEVINDITEKGLKIDIRWDDCRILRTRKPDGLRFWKGSEELTLGGIPATQAEIEKELGLPYQSFVNITYFGQHNKLHFLACDPSTKRGIVENILALDQYNTYCKVAKEKKKKIDTDIAVATKQYTVLSSTLDTYKKQHDLLNTQSGYWIKQKEHEIATLEKRLHEVEQELGNINDAQISVAELLNELNVLQEYQKKVNILVINLKEEKNRLANVVSDSKLKLSEINNKKELLTYRMSKIEEELKRIANLQPGSCPVCFSAIDQDNSSKVTDHLNEHLDILVKEASELNKSFDVAYKQFNIDNEAEKETKTTYTTALERKLWTEKKVLEYLDNIRKAEIKLEQMKGGESGILLRLLEEKRAEFFAGHPFHDAICQAEMQLIDVIKKVTESRDAVKLSEEKIPYIDFWIKAFGDQGIRKLVIQDILPVLNNRINHWLMFLADGNLRLTFDTEFQETITYGPPVNRVCRYNGLSGGELCRVDLAILQGFAQITAFNSKICPMFTCLDEVAADVDRPGVACLYNTILELAKERRVFVVTHDPDLQSLLAGHDTLIFERQNGITRLVKE